MGSRELAQPLDHPCRIRAAIYEVPEKGEPHGPDGSLLEIVDDPAEQVVEQVEPAVDVANGIQALAGRPLKAGRATAARRNSLASTRSSATLSVRFSPCAANRRGLIARLL